MTWTLPDQKTNPQKWTYWSQKGALRRSFYGYYNSTIENTDKYIKAKKNQMECLSTK